MPSELVDDTAVIFHGRVIAFAMHEARCPEQADGFVIHPRSESAGAGKDGATNRDQDRWNQSFLDQPFGVAGKSGEQ